MKFILGPAGTGKTYLLKESIDLLKDVIVFCYTHSGVSNIGCANTHTFHSYFNLDFNNNYKKLKQVKEHNILIDEIGIVPLKIFNLICKFDKTHNIICYGDLLQLSPIENLNIKFYPDIPFKCQLTPAEAARVYVKMNQTLYVNKKYKQSEKLILTYNHRASDHIMRMMWDALDDEIELVGYNDIKNLLKSNYVVIASRYKHLKYINQNFTEDNVQDNHVLTKIGSCQIKQEFRLCQTLNKLFLNNSIVHIENNALINSNGGLVINPDEKQQIMPLNFITVHKSQGLEFDKVLIILDDLFDISMLYTMITRAKKEVKFFIISPNKEKVLEEVKTLNKCFAVFKKMIYT